MATNFDGDIPVYNPFSAINARIARMNRDQLYDPMTGRPIVTAGQDLGVGQRMDLDPNKLSDTLYNLEILRGVSDGGGDNKSGGSGNSRLGYGVAGGANVLGSGIAAIMAQRALNARRRKGVIDIRPESFKNMEGEYALKAASTKLPNYAQAVSNIDATQAQADANAALAASSPAQLQALVARNARIAAQSKMGLDQAGVGLQRENLGIKRQLGMQSANYQDRARQEYNTDVANLRNAVWSNVNNMINSAGQTALMMF
jgi:hypothetical protein